MTAQAPPTVIAFTHTTYTDHEELSPTCARYSGRRHLDTAPRLAADLAYQAKTQLWQRIAAAYAKPNTPHLAVMREIRDAIHAYERTVRKPRGS